MKLLLSNDDGVHADGLAILAAALKDLEEARVLFDNSDEKRGQILTKLSLAQVLYALGRTDEADQLYEEGVSQARAEGLHTYLESYT